MKRYVIANAEVNYKGQTYEQWEADNQRIADEFAKWLDSSAKAPFQVDEYNIFEKMPLREVRNWLKPDSEPGWSYNSSDEVLEDNWWYVLYSNGKSLNLEEGDSLKGVPRSGIVVAINDNSSTTMVYGKSSHLYIYNTASFDDNNDIWRCDVK